MPNYLIKRYTAWKATVYEENKNWYNKIAIEAMQYISNYDIDITEYFSNNRIIYDKYQN